jgi:hypothetical protein
MKVRIGGVERSVANQSDLKQVEDQIANTIVNGAIAEALDITPRFLDRLQERVQISATREANRVMDTIVDVIDNPQFGTDPGLNGANLTRGTDLFASGRVDWKPLSFRYTMRKDRQVRRWGAGAKAARARSSKMFFNRGTLRNYLKGRGSTIIRNRLGGMEVKVDRKLTDRSFMSANNRWTKRASDFLGEGDVGRIVLGRVELTMFPRLSPAMAPMLATRRWTDAGDGAMEKAVFGGTKTLAKLLNRRDAYRALLTPVVQFFMLVRIPAAVNRSVTDYLRRTSIGAD